MCFEAEAHCNSAMPPRRGRRSREITAEEQIQTVAVIDATTGVQSILSALETLGPAGSSRQSFKRKRAQEELYDIAKTLTPYGLVCEKGHIRGADGELEIYHVNPFALLHLACEKYMRFRQFVAGIVASSPDHMVDIVYYLDKATPGNIKRFDKGRMAQCMYFTFLQFP